MKRRRGKVLMKRATREEIDRIKERVKEARKDSELYAMWSGAVSGSINAGKKDERLFSESEIREIFYAGIEEDI